MSVENLRNSGKRLVLTLEQTAGDELPTDAKGKTKRFSLNKTNVTKMRTDAGDDYGTWEGKTITFEAQSTKFAGNDVSGLRITSVE